MKKKTLIIQFTFFALILICIFYFFLSKECIFFVCFLNETKEIQGVNWLTRLWAHKVMFIDNHGGKVFYAIYPLILAFMWWLSIKYRENRKFILAFQALNILVFIGLLLTVTAFYGFIFEMAR